MCTHHIGWSTSLHLSGWDDELDFGAKSLGCRDFTQVLKLKLTILLIEFNLMFHVYLGFRSVSCGCGN